MSTITATFDVPDELLRDILITACEGGIQYWAEVGVYRHSGPQPYCEVWDHAGGCDPEDPGITVKATDLSKGLQRLLAEYPTHPCTARMVKAVVNYESGDFDYDADDADAVFQLAALGEWIYG